MKTWLYRLPFSSATASSASPGILVLGGLHLLLPLQIQLGTLGNPVPETTAICTFHVGALDVLELFHRVFERFQNGRDALTSFPEKVFQIQEDLLGARAVDKSGSDSGLA